MDNYWLLFDWTALQAEQEALITGFYTTLGVTLISVILATLLALTLCFMQSTGRPTLQILAQSWVEIIRNIPLLIQIYFFYKALPVTGIVLPPIACGIIALSLNGSAYLAEVFRTGLESLPTAQKESAASLGLSTLQRFRHVLWPQLLPVVLPPMSSVVVNIVKNSSLLAFITVSDLFYVVYKGGVTFFHYIEFFTIGLAGYLLLNYLVTLTFSVLEHWATPAYAKATPKGFTLRFSSPQLGVQHAQHRLASLPVFNRKGRR